MKIIILEGIATSGKTTIKNDIIKYFNKHNYTYSIVEEDETLMSILDNVDENIAKNHLKKIINVYFTKEKDYLIFDRLYFTHIHRTNSNITHFKEIEDLIINKKGKVIFLKINEIEIEKRIFNAMKHRSEKWNKYVLSKGNKEEIIQYYINQQKNLLNYLEKSNVNSMIIDTTKMNFGEITSEIIKSQLH